MAKRASSAGKSLPLKNEAFTSAALASILKKNKPQQARRQTVDTVDARKRERRGGFCLTPEQGCFDITDEGGGY